MKPQGLRKMGLKLLPSFFALHKNMMKMYFFDTINDISVLE